MRWEPVYEVTQMKGDGETHPKLSPKDKFADFYTWDKGSFGPDPKTPDMLPREYAREALKRGLAYDRKARRQPVQVRHDRLHRLAHRPVDGRREQLLRQDRGAGADGRPDPLLRAARRAVLEE